MHSSLFLLPLLVAASNAASYADLGIPPSSAMVDVKILNSVAGPGRSPAQPMIFPVIPGRENLDTDVYAFLIQHGNERVMFDLGIQKDPQNLAPIWSRAIAAGLIFFNVTEDVPTQLQKGNVSLDSIKSVIWSHGHADHVGDMSLWPSTTEIVISEETDTSSYPTSPNATLLDSDFAGKSLRKISFTNSTLKIGGFPAVDYFGDGSLYLLSVPGHIPGHMAALLRTTRNSFILLAADTFHQAGEVRPSAHLHDTVPVPPQILSASKKSIARKYFWAPDDHTDLSTRTWAFLSVANGPNSFYADPVESTVSQLGITVFDSNPDVFVISAHDPSMGDLLDFFPKSLSSWKQKGWKQNGVWKFADPAARGYRLS